MHVPPWLTLGVAIVVIVFGGYRMWLALRKPDPDADAKRRPLLGGGFYKMSPRTHAMVGIVYLALGGALIATTFGWNPFGLSSDPAAPTKHAPVRIDAVVPTK